MIPVELNRMLTTIAAIVLGTAVALAQTGGGSNALWLSISLQKPDVVLQWPSRPGEHFQLEHRPGLTLLTNWQPLATNFPAGSNAVTEYIHTNALFNSTGYYRVALSPAFTFDWTGTNFTYTDAAGGETNAANMGNCAENNARAVACANVLASLAYVDTNRLAIFGHSMGAFASIGDAAQLGNRLRAAAITSGGIIPDSAGANNIAPTVTEASPMRTPFIMFHCDADPVVPPVRSQLFQQLLNTNAVINQRILYSSNSIPNMNNWHNIHQDATINANVLTNTYQWFQTHGVIP